MSIGMDLPPGGSGNLLSVILQNLLDTQQRIYSQMATKDDLAVMRTELNGANADHERRITLLEREKLPKWFWPSLVSLIGICGTVVGLLVQSGILHGHGVG